MATKRHRQQERLRREKLREERQAEKDKVSTWSTFAEMVDAAWESGRGDSAAYVIEGLMHLGREAEAQALAIECLCFLAKGQEAIRLAVQKKWFKHASARYTSSTTLRMLILWAKQKCINSTWPPQKQRD